MRKTWWLCAAGLTALFGIAATVASQGQASAAEEREWKTYESTKYGFSLKIPAEFKLESEDKTTTWIYQPSAKPAAGAEAPKAKKGFKVGAKIKELAGGAGQAAEAPAGDAGGGLESALSIHVNWAWMPDVSSDTLYNANMDSVKKDMTSPDPNYTDPIVFSKKKGYAHEGNAFWYKEVDKKAADEIHRWHIGAYGNKSNYGVILGGVYGQFEEWGPVYEEIVKSFKLIPIKE